MTGHTNQKQSSKKKTNGSDTGLQPSIVHFCFEKPERYERILNRSILFSHFMVLQMGELAQFDEKTCGTYRSFWCSRACMRYHDV